jgi:hypothetical protein
VSIPHSFRRPTQLCAIACALLAPAAAASAASDPLAQERQYMSQPAAASVPQEQYYSSYGEPQPLSAPQPAAGPDETPWLPIAISAALALAVGVASPSLFRRVRVRRRAAA